jgi:hypothetical protein
MCAFLFGCFWSILWLSIIFNRYINTCLHGLIFLSLLFVCCAYIPLAAHVGRFGYGNFSIDPSWRHDAKDVAGVTTKSRQLWKCQNCLTFIYLCWAGLTWTYFGLAPFIATASMKTLPSTFYLRSIYTKHNFCVAPSCTAASDTVRIDPNLVGLCCSIWCDTKNVFNVNMYPFGVGTKSLISSTLGICSPLHSTEE